jgi:uncharacterized protein YqgV (UPF0045/DUF77 family)
MELAEAAQQACFDAGATDLLVYMKLQRSKDKSVMIEDKMAKYR